MNSFGKILYQPDALRIADSRMKAFADAVGQDVGESLWRWSVENRPAFWEAVWKEFEVVGSMGATILEAPDSMAESRFFPEARLSFAENLLRHRGPQPALIRWDERGRRGEISRDALRQQVSALAVWMKSKGVGEGDVVAAYMPNIPETVITMLAANCVGATFSSCSQDFGVKGALDRLGQIRPKVLVAADGYFYGGKPRPAGEKLGEILAGLAAAGLENLLWVEQLGQQAAPPTLVPATLFVDAISTPAPAAPTFLRLPFNHPLYILFSSGTTGLPKGIVHGQGGTLLQQWKELGLHCDLREGEKLFYYTTCGWMMWNWLVAGLGLGAPVVLYDGSPFAPTEDILWQMAEAEKLSLFGTSAKYLAELEKRGICVRENFRLPSLRAILSTGSVLRPESFDFVYREIKEDLQLASISGGTDIISCFALGDPTRPVRRGELQSRGLGMKVEVYSPDGRSLSEGQGELVCTASFPSMPVGFWKDPEGERYRLAYFARFEGIWHHGDYVELRPGGSMVFHGRSDATLNPGGVRIGTAEIYRIVDQFEEIRESVVVGLDRAGDIEIALFVVMQPGFGFGEELALALRKRLREQASPHHVPRHIAAVTDIPKTVSGKTSEIAVRRLLQGEAVENRAALANPEALDLFLPLRAQLGLDAT